MPDMGNQITKTEYETYITLAGGRIRCLRCTARSTRTKQQCGRPALKDSRTQKCQFHGGGSTGPKTAEGKQRINDAHLKHGESSRSARLEHSQASAKLSQLEDALYLLGMTTAPRIRGRKALGYRPVRTIEDIRRMLLNDNLHLNKAVV